MPKVFAKTVQTVTETVYSQKDICDLTGISSGYISRLIQDGKVVPPSIKIGLRHYFSNLEKEAILKQINERDYSR